MPANPNGDGFTETTELPRGRKAREVPDIVWAKLDDSASRKVGFNMVGTADKIDELKRDLGAASVKAKYDVTVETEKAGAEKPGRSKLKAGTLRLTFSAVAKDVAGRSEAQPEAQPEPETASA